MDVLSLLVCVFRRLFACTAHRGDIGLMGIHREPEQIGLMCDTSASSRMVEKLVSTSSQ